MEPTQLIADKMQMSEYIHIFFPKVIITASQFYCLPAEIFGLHIFILNAPEQTVPATQMNKMLNRCKWLLSYSYSDNQLMESSQVVPYLSTNNLKLSIMFLFPLNIDYILCFLYFSLIQSNLRSSLINIALQQWIYGLEVIFCHAKCIMCINTSIQQKAAARAKI